MRESALKDVLIKYIQKLEVSGEIVVINPIENSVVPSALGVNNV